MSKDSSSLWRVVLPLVLMLLVLVLLVLMLLVVVPPVLVFPVVVLFVVLLLVGALLVLVLLVVLLLAVVLPVVLLLVEITWQIHLLDEVGSGEGHALVDRDHKPEAGFKEVDLLPPGTGDWEVFMKMLRDDLELEDQNELVLWCDHYGSRSVENV